jgi:hypothetical protein
MMQRLHVSLSRRLLAAALLFLALLAPVADARAGSTVNPSIPATNSPLVSAPIRGNFAAAFNDINNILTKFSGVAAPASPSCYQDWADTSTLGANSIVTFRFWNCATSAWVAWGTLNTATNTFSATGVTLAVGSTPISGGTNNGLLYNNAGVLQNLATGNNGVLVTSGAGAPSISTTLPIGMTIPSPSLTGVPTAPTAAPGTNTIQIATTAFVQAATASACPIGGFVVSLGGGTSQCSTAGGNGFGAILNGGLQLSPQANTLGQGFSVTQTLPAAGSQTGPYSANIINVTDNGYTLTGVGIDSFGLLQANLAAFRANLTATTANAENYAAIFAVTTTTNPGGEYIGAIGSAYNNVTGTPGVGNLYGLIAAAQIGPNATNNQVIGINVEVGGTGTSVLRKGVSLSSLGTTQGSTLDTAIIVNAAGGSPGWQKVITISQAGTGPTPVATNADIFYADTAGTTIGNFANFTNVFVQGNIWVSNNLIIPGAFASNFVLPTHSSGFIEYGTQIAGGAGLQISNFTGPAYFIGNRADTSSTAPSAVQTDEAIVALSAQPFDGIGYFEIGAIAIKAAQALTNTHHGSYISFFAAAINANSEVENARIGPTGLTLFTAPAQPTGNGVATLGSSSTNGLFADGQGSVNDVTLANKNQSPVLTIPTGTTNVAVGGNLTVPTIFGGSAVGSTATLNGTSNGSPSAAYVLVQTNGQFTTFGGTLTPQALITATLNSGTPSQNPIAGTILWLVGQDSASNNAFVLDQYNGVNRIVFRRGNNTAASPTAATANSVLGAFDFYGYTGSAFYRGAAMVSTATETYSGTAGGTDIEWFTTPNTTHTLTQAVVFRASGGLAIGNVNTDPGAGSIYFDQQIFGPNITTSSAAQTGTVCWTTGTGKLTVDTTVGCLTSIEEAKDILGYLDSRQALHLVERLMPFSFRYKRGWGDGGRYEQFGLGAHQVASVDERMVGRDPDGALQGVRYQELTAVLVGAIQEIKADNDNLREEIDVLKRAVGR